MTRSPCKKKKKKREYTGQGVEENWKNPEEKQSNGTPF